MADLDSRSKRASSVGILLGFAILAPLLPDAAITQPDRKHIAWSYSGIIVATGGDGATWSGSISPFGWRRMGATNLTIGGRGTLFVGEHKTLTFHVLDRNGVPIDLDDWDDPPTLDVRKSDASAAASLLVNTTIEGIYNSDPLINTQRAVAVLTSGDTLALGAREYRYSLKRIDSGSETILMYGDFVVQRATQI